MIKNHEKHKPFVTLVLVLCLRLQITFCYVCMCICECKYPWSPEEASRSPRAGVTSACESTNSDTKN